MADDTIAKIGIDVDVTGAKEAGDQLDNLGKKGKKAEGGLKNIAKGANKTNGPFRAMRGSTQQLSWQLQDVAVQAQMGTSAFTILGQQGPQIASIFGSGGAVFGVLIAFGAIVAGAVYNGLMMTGDAVKRLDKEMEALTGDFDNLTGELRAFTKALVNKEIAENTVLINKLQKQYDALSAPVQNSIDSFGSFTDHSESAGKAVTLLKVKILSLEKNNETLAKSVDDLTNSTEDLITNLDEELLTLGMTNVELVAYQAVMSGATDEQTQLAMSTAAATEREEKRLKSIEDLKAATKKATEEQEAYSLNLQHQLRLLQETGPALDAYKASVEGGTELQQKDNAELERKIRVLKEKIALDAEAQKKSDAKAKSDEKAAERDKEAAKKLVEQIALQNMTELEQLKEHQKTKLAQLDQDLAAGHILEQQYLDSKAHMKETYRLAEELATEESNKKIYDSDKAYADAKASLDQQVLSSAAGVIGQLADAAEEGSNAQKALFAIQKGIAIATAIVNTELAAATALAPPPLGLGPIAGAGYAQVIRAMGYASVGIMAGTAIAGGRALGGQVRGGESYLVGERGPELLTMGTSGRIATNENLKNAVGGNSGSGVTVNQTINVTTGIQSTVRAEIVQLMPQIAQAAKGAVADGRQRGGNFSRAMSGA